MQKQVVVIAGPAGSGKDTLARRLLEKFPKTTLMVTATTRAPRPGEKEGVNYYFLSKEKFQEELANGNIVEHYHRADTDTYYGTYKPDIDARIASGKIVIAIIQIVGARYMKEQYKATTLFIMPPDRATLEKRIRSRSPMSDIEWQERFKIMEEEVQEHSGWYDYRVTNEEGKLEESVASVVAILQKEGYTLEQ